MTRIDVPEWAPAHARNALKLEGKYGQAAKDIFLPFLPNIYEELDRRVNEFANDPDQCFDTTEDFPQQSKLDGRYYFGSQVFEGDSADGPYRLWLIVRCLEKPWHPSQERDGYDYLQLEAIVTVEGRGAEPEFEEGFNTSSV
jgi:hypothetical protein